jgi:DNA replication and repair protein RecF
MGADCFPRLQLEHLRVRDVRNLVQVELDPAPRINVISGNNGHGKTSLLEAIYFVATSRSFRTHRLAELVRHGERIASVVARLREASDSDPGVLREQVAAVERKTAVVRIDGTRPANLAEYATRSPVVAFHANELALSSGPASGRRTLLDRLALFLSPASADHRARYARALKARQLLLHQLRSESVDTPAVEAFEDLCAVHGAALTAARSRAVESLAAELLPAFRRIAAPDVNLEVRFAPGGSVHPDEARAELARQRARDAHRPSAGFGPHRDDLELSFDGHPVRLVASQGQHRALTLALKAAEASAIAAARGVEPILLLDDVSSELDPDRTHALFTFLGVARGQLFLTTTRPELIPTPDATASDRRDFRLEGGALVASR